MEDMMVHTYYDQWYRGDVIVLAIGAGVVMLWEKAADAQLRILIWNNISSEHVVVSPHFWQRYMFGVSREVSTSRWWSWQIIFKQLTNTNIVPSSKQQGYITFNIGLFSSWNK